MKISASNPYTINFLTGLSSQASTSPKGMPGVNGHEKTASHG